MWKNHEEIEEPTFKVLLLGDEGVGKTTFVKRLLTGICLQPPLSTEVNPVRFHTNRGPVTFNVWDPIEHESLARGFYVKSDLAIVMFDVTSSSSFNNVGKWCHEVQQNCGDIPIIVCGNKIDLEQHDRVLPSRTGETEVKYYDVSAKTKINLEKPFLWLLRQRAADEGVYFVEPLPSNKDGAVEEEVTENSETADEEAQTGGQDGEENEEAVTNQAEQDAAEDDYYYVVGEYCSAPWWM